MLLRRNALTQLRAIYADRTLEIEQPLLLGDEPFGSIRIGLSTLLMRGDLQQALRDAAATALVALLVATGGALLLAQWMLRPIHVIRSGLTRLGQGEFDLTLDLPPGDDFAVLGKSFKAISAQLSAGRQESDTSGGSLNSAGQPVEDGIAIFDPNGELLFSNLAMRATLPPADPGSMAHGSLPEGHPYRSLVTRALSGDRPQGPVSAPVPWPGDDQPGRAEHPVMAHAIKGRNHQIVGVVLVAHNLGPLSQGQSTSSRVASMGRLLAGVAHEVRNPLNAMAIHVELLRQKLAVASEPDPSGPKSRHGSLAAPSILGIGSVAGVSPVPGTVSSSSDEADTQTTVPAAGVTKHLSVISGEIRRLDEVIQGFLRFIRPEEVHVQPISPANLIEEVVRVVEPEAGKMGVIVSSDCPAGLPDVSGDPAMLKQALLNLALNAFQAMPDGGTPRLGGRSLTGRRVAVDVEDTGIGIAPDHLEKIFNLYFTTKEHGSGIGLSLVYRTIQLHGGEVEVQSAPGAGTKFRLTLPQA